MKLVYIASPLRGDYEGNVKKAIEYCKKASECGVVPLAPHTIFTQWCNDTILEEREKGLQLGLELLARVDELWVMGTEITEGMRGEIHYAKDLGIPAYQIKNPKEIECYPISANEHDLLGAFDVLGNSRTDDYTNQMVVLEASVLKPEYKIAMNQLWIATHGPGCRQNGIGDTIHLTHIMDKDCLCVGRSDILGIVKSEIAQAIIEHHAVNEKKRNEMSMEYEDRSI